MNKDTFIKKLFNNLSTFLVIILSTINFFIAASLLSLSTKVKNNDGSSILGYEVRIVLTESMKRNDNLDYKNYQIKDIEKDSAVLIKLFDENINNDEISSLNVGDVVSFYYQDEDVHLYTHRLIDIDEIDDYYILTFKGDNNPSGTIEVIDTSKLEFYHQLHGKVIFNSLVLGKIIKVLQNKLALLFIFIIPSLVLLIFEIVKCIKLISLEENNA